MSAPYDPSEIEFPTEPLQLQDSEILTDSVVDGRSVSEPSVDATCETLLVDAAASPTDAQAYLRQSSLERQVAGSSAGWLHNQWVWMEVLTAPTLARLSAFGRRVWALSGTSPRQLFAPVGRGVDAAGQFIDAVARLFSRHALPIFLFALLALLSLGTVMIFSASAKTAMKIASIGDPGFYIKKHLLFLGIGLFACAAMSHIGIDRLRRWIVPISLGMLVVLLAVLLPGIGTEYNGARRWLRFAGMGFQPSDAAKLVMVFAVAHLVVSRTKMQNASFREGFLPPALYLGAVCGLVVLEPDFGTCLFIAATGLIVMLLGGVRPRVLVPIALVAIPLLSLVVIMKFDHVKPRIETFLNPYADPMGKGYQTRQSLIAMGAGGFVGQGLGQSRQALAYLPEESTDFIFAILGEELGFIGTAGTILAYLLLVLAGFAIASRSRDRFAMVVTAGMTTLIGLQAAINIAVVTATVPNKGIALPFVSFGGSLTVFYLAAAGVILQTAFANHRAEKAVAGLPEHVTLEKGDATLVFQAAETMIRPADADATVIDAA